jgi:hypothetical protein
MEAERKNLTPGRNDSIPGSYLASLINQYASDDALFCGDDGTPVVWALRLLEANGKR